MHCMEKYEASGFVSTIARYIAMLKVIDLRMAQSMKNGL